MVLCQGVGVYMCFITNKMAQRFWGIFFFQIAFHGRGREKETRRGSSSVENGVTLWERMRCVFEDVSPFTEFIILEPKSQSTEKILAKKNIVCACVCGGEGGISCFFFTVCGNVRDYVFGKSDAILPNKKKPTTFFEPAVFVCVF